ncbi:hypothetical protein EVG20_g4906 [Dentipellis fragilis]|uniref:ZZ-type domain-containing protein n=1 Tax=Dentipellis fragilis TaxID=205917 RepID=A0A4Y9YWZ2_9AGAM|nr:hypothetical protein EVG20_g4906 [Dentipellis fragilis]
MRLDELEEAEHLDFVTDPEDLGYCLAILQFIRLRQILHNNILCDSCDADPIRTTKMICLECSRGVAVEFCVDCFDQSVRIDTDDVKTHHVSAHAVLQLRSIIPTRYMYSTLKKARSILSQAQSQLRPLGGEGLKVPTTSERPKSTRLPHVKIRMRKESLWSWAHPLVLVHSPQDEVLEFSIEDKLQSLENTLQLLGHKIEGVESMITTCFQEMERLVLGLVDTSSRGQTGQWHP